MATMKSKVRFFAGAFAVTAILMMALCGFMLVDLSADRYMPGHLQPMFLISSIGADGVELSFMGKEYTVSTRPPSGEDSLLAALKGLLPVHVQIGEALGGQLYLLTQAEADTGPGDVA